MKKFELIKSETTLLSISKDKNEPFFTVLDSDSKIIAKFSKKALGLFLNGEITILDSRGQYWNYSSLNKELKHDPVEFTRYLLEVL
jgi:hypothetical protein